MHRILTLTTDPIDEPALVRSRGVSTTAGAVVTFLGVVRDSEAAAPIAALDYEAFDAMARHQFGKIFDEIEHRWPMVESLRLVHRLGRVAAGEPSLWVEILTPHRAEALAATQWLIEEMKRVVPIWKRPIPAPIPGGAA